MPSPSLTPSSAYLERSASGARSRPVCGSRLPIQGCTGRARDVAGHGVDRFDLAPVALPRPGVHHDAIASGHRRPNVVGVGDPFAGPGSRTGSWRAPAKTNPRRLPTPRRSPSTSRATAGRATRRDGRSRATSTTTWPRRIHRRRRRRPRGRRRRCPPSPSPARTLRATAADGGRARRTPGVRGRRRHRTTPLPAGDPERTTQRTEAPGFHRTSAITRPSGGRNSDPSWPSSHSGVTTMSGSSTDEKGTRTAPAGGPSRRSGPGLAAGVSRNPALVAGFRNVTSSGSHVDYDDETAR